MSTIYPDVNKYYQGDTKLCWAAAAANALVWTGWNQALAQARGTPVMDEETLYLYFKVFSPKGMTNQGWSAIEAIAWILENYGVNVPILKVAQRRTPYELFLCPFFLSEQDHRCAIFSVSSVLPNEEFDHEITAYEVSNDITRGFAANDPRSVSMSTYCDSDDRKGLIRTVHEEHKGPVAYYPSGRAHAFLYRAGRTLALKEWTLVHRNPNAVF